MLARVKSPSAKAGVYLKYLSNCHFNRHQNPDSIIQFSQEDVIQLTTIEEEPERAEQVQ